LNNSLKTIVSILALCVASPSLWAVDIGKGNGKLNGSIKAMSILDAKDNAYDPNNGSSYLFKLKYESPIKNNLKLGVGLYNSGDLFSLTDFDTERVARGMFVTDDGSNKTQFGEIYLDYKTKKVHAFGGRMKYNTPLTKNSSSTMPNFHTVFGASVVINPKTKVGVAQVTEMSFGSRSMTDFGLIGEGTKSAGAATKTSALGQAEFHDIGKATFGKNGKDTKGITVVNVEFKPSKTLKFNIWDYYADDIANNIYLQADKTIPLKGQKLKFSGQYLTQSAVGATLGGDIDFNMLGVKASLGNKQWGVFAAANKSSGDTAMLNAWGGDPGFTSSIFSRNEYRENVTAFKVGGRYKITPKLTLSGGYADYGQSDTSAPAKVLKVAATGRVVSQTDAIELDIALTWKPQKNVMLKLFHANRTSEYDGANGKDLTQAHTRLIGVYKF
jgi:hypothetical protein